MAKVFIKVELSVSELVYDVENKTSLTGIAHEDQNYKQSADMRMTEVEEHRNQLMRSIGNAWATLKNELFEYVCASGTTADNIQMGDSEDSLVACLGMPTNFDLAAKEAIATGMHQYIVNTALVDWLNIYSQEDASVYAAMAVANLKQIHKAINRRNRPYRRKPCDCC